MDEELFHGKNNLGLGYKLEEKSLSKREIDEAKQKIKDLLQIKIDAGEMNIEDILVSEF